MGQKRKIADAEAISVTDDTEGTNKGKKVKSTENSSLFEDDVFTFLVGPNKTRFIVHVGALRDVSEPLAYMVTNDKMAESLQKKAVLKDVESAVFEQLVAYAYSGVYGLKTSTYISDDGKFEIFAIRCHYCGKLFSSSSDNTHYPFCSPTCHTSGIKAYRSNGPFYVHCILPGCTGKAFITCTPTNTATFLCEKHDKSENRAIFCTDRRCASFVTHGKTSFALRTYGSAKLSHSELRSIFLTLNSVSKPLVDVTFHAKLYVLADRYMISDLKDIALHKLHNNLLATVPTEETIQNIIELINYVYSNTNDEGDAPNGIGNKLRELVVAYIVEHSKAIGVYPAFKDMLSAGGSYSVDIFMAQSQAQAGK